MRVNSKKLQAVCLFCLFTSISVLLFSLSPKTVHADNSISITETGDAVHTIPATTIHQSPYNATTGNGLVGQVYGYALNPLKDGDPNYDYYIFDVYAAANAGSGWSLDTSGLSDPGGPSLVVNVSAPSCNAQRPQTLMVSNLSPSSEVDTSGNSPVTTGVTVSVGPVFFGISNTFTPPATQTAPTHISQCYTGWASAINTKGQQGAYSYDFAIAMQVPENQAPYFAVSVGGSFNEPCGFEGLFTCYDHPEFSFADYFQMPPTTIITSSPAGLYFVEVDGNPVTTPGEYVWSAGDVHTLTASPSVEGGIGVRYYFRSWSDNGQESHSILAPSTPTTYVANFQKQDQLTVSQTSGGTLDLPAGSYWYNDGQTVVIHATPNGGYVLDHWVLDGLNGGTGNQISVLMNSPHSLTAVFAGQGSAGQTSSQNASSNTGPNGNSPGATASGLPDNTSLYAIAIIAVALIGVLVGIAIRRRK